MSEPSEQAKRKAQELFDSALHLPGVTILARYIQTVSDVAKPIARKMQLSEPLFDSDRYRLESLILPDEPDPVDKFAKWLNGCSKDSKGLQEAAAIFGLKIVLSDD